MKEQEAKLESSRGFNRGNRSYLKGGEAGLSKAFKDPCLESMKFHENPGQPIKSVKIMQINGDYGTYMKYDERLQRARNQPGIEQRFL